AVAHEIAGQAVIRDALRLEKLTDLLKANLEAPHQSILGVHPDCGLGTSKRGQSGCQAMRKGRDLFIFIVAADVGERRGCLSQSLDCFRVGWSWLRLKRGKCGPEQGRGIGNDRKLLVLRLRHKVLDSKGMRHLR